MTEPSLALQGAIYQALMPAVSPRVYDRVPGNPTFPYITIGDDQVIGEHAECLEGSVEVFATVHVWSRAVGKAEAKQLAGAVVTALNGAALTLPGYRLVLIEHDATQHLDDPDGLTSHSVVVFHARVDEE